MTDTMKNAHIMRGLAAVLFAAACGGDDDSTTGPTPVGPTANVRFFNATTGMTGSAGFTTNGQFATGSALAFGQATPTCANVTAGSTSFEFGAANSGGTGLSGNALATMSGQSITADGNYTVVATGAATSPKLFLLDNSSSVTPGANQAAVRFVNLRRLHGRVRDPQPNTDRVQHGGRRTHGVQDHAEWRQYTLGPAESGSQHGPSEHHRHLAGWHGQHVRDRSDYDVGRFPADPHSALLT
jgi:hypothetical protein